MSSWVIFAIIILYFLVLIVISLITSRKADNETFFTAHRQSPWYVVAYGMIGASLSGVTFISVPGWVGTTGFSYFQMVLGYIPGYLFILGVLLPIYYRLKVKSIYSYLEQRFGSRAYKMGVFYFLFSRIFGASARLFIVAEVLQYTFFNQLHIPFFITVFITIVLIWIYTHRGGIKTIVWTDLFQTTFMLLAVIIVFISIIQLLGYDFSTFIKKLNAEGYTRTFHFQDFKSSSHFIKQFLGGALIAIAMTGLDQDMMQKNLTCKNVKESQKNMFYFSLTLIPVNLLFLTLGASLYYFAQQKGIALPARADMVFPHLATRGYLPLMAGVFFMLGIIAAAYSSADSALTALTTSVSVDLLKVDRMEESKALHYRKIVHIIMSFILFSLIMILHYVNKSSIIDTLFRVSSFTYGPLLGIFVLGIFTNLQLKNHPWIFVASVLAPAFSYMIYTFSARWFHGYQFGYEILLVNALLTIVFLLPVITRHHVTGSKPS